MAFAPFIGMRNDIEQAQQVAIAHSQSRSHATAVAGMRQHRRDIHSQPRQACAMFLDMLRQGAAHASNFIGKADRIHHCERQPGRRGLRPGANGADMTRVSSISA